MVFGRKKPTSNAEESQPQGQTILAYGFDKAGFQCPQKPISVDGVGLIQFVGFNAPRKLDDADGVIIPSGIFEKFEPRHYGGMRQFKISFERDLMIDRERQVTNLVRDGKWVCFLVEQVLDQLPENDYREVRDTDLCKRILNTYQVYRQPTPDALQLGGSLCQEFADYIRHYGVAKTIFGSDGIPDDIGYTVIAQHETRPVALEVGRNVFFLPFHMTDADLDSVSELVRTVAEAVSKYRQNRNEDIPDWADAFEFTQEASLQKERHELRVRLHSLDESIEGWRINKSILVSVGDALAGRLVKILRDYFGLTVDSQDKRREDAKILDDQGKPCVLLEFKGTGGGLKREDVDQMLFHRKRADVPLVPPTVAGVLIVNCNRKVTSVDDRSAQLMPRDQIEYARTLNVLVVRTIDLLFLMRQLEGKPVAERREVLMKAFLAGGGWLKATAASYGIVTA